MQKGKLLLRQKGSLEKQYTRYQTPFTIPPRPFLKHNSRSGDQAHSLFKQKRSSVLSLCLPVMCWQSLTLKALAPNRLPHLPGSFLATPHCLSRHLQVISGLSAGKTHLFQIFCLLCFYWYIHPVLPTRSEIFM